MVTLNSVVVDLQIFFIFHKGSLWVFRAAILWTEGPYLVFKDIFGLFLGGFHGSMQFAWFPGFIFLYIYQILLIVLDEVPVYKVILSFTLPCGSAWDVEYILGIEALYMFDVLLIYCVGLVVSLLQIGSFQYLELYQLNIILINILIRHFNFIPAVK